jgi:hypothetical protein
VRGLPAVHPIFVAYRACAEVIRYVPMTVGALSLEKARDWSTNERLQFKRDVSVREDVANALFEQVEANDSDCNVDDRDGGNRWDRA